MKGKDIFDKMMEKDITSYIIAWACDSGEFLEMANMVFSSESSYSIPGYNNQKLKEVSLKAAEEFNFLQKRKYLEQIQEIVMEDLPAIPLVYPMETFGFRNDIYYKPRAGLRFIGAEMTGEKIEEIPQKTLYDAIKERIVSFFKLK